MSALLILPIVTAIGITYISVINKSLKNKKARLVLRRNLYQAMRTNIAYKRGLA